MSEETVTTGKEEGADVMGKKEKPELKKRKGTTDKPVAAQKQPRAKKDPLKIKAGKEVEVKETKYVQTATKGEKRMWLRGSSVGLTHKVTGFKALKPVTEEEAKKNHLGKTRMLGKVASQDELNELVTKYFA